jgi:hypothetical protein
MGGVSITVTASTTSRLCISEKKCSELGDKDIWRFKRTGTGSIEITDDVGHTSLVSHHGGEVDGLLGVILWPSRNWELDQDLEYGK